MTVRNQQPKTKQPYRELRVQTLLHALKMIFPTHFND